METTAFSEYLALLDTLYQQLKELTELTQREITAAEGGDLAALDQIVRQKQALSLSLRGLEQKRSALLEEIGLQEVPFSELSDFCPSDLHMEARQITGDLRQQYQTYCEHSDTARQTLTRNLDEINAVMEKLDPQSAANDCAVSAAVRRVAGMVDCKA